MNCAARCILCAFIFTAVFVTPLLADTVAFSDVESGPLSGGFAILGVNNPTFPSTYQSVADPFTAAASGTLSQIDLGLFSASGSTNPVDVSVYTDVNNALGALVFSTSISKEPLYGSNALTTIVAGSGNLTAGDNYFLLLSAGTPDTVAGWADNNVGARGPLLIGSFGGYTWLSNQKLSAFDVKVNAATVPEPSSWLMVGAEALCLVSVVLWKRRASWLLDCWQALTR